MGAFAVLFIYTPEVRRVQLLLQCHIRMLTSSWGIHAVTQRPQDDLRPALIVNRCIQRLCDRLAWA